MKYKENHRAWGIRGSSTPPTEDEIEAAEAAGRSWIVRFSSGQIVVMKPSAVRQSLVGKFGGDATYWPIAADQDGRIYIEGSGD